MYEYLVEVDQVMKFKGMLATEWSMAPDAKQWTFKLRRGVQWHRGFGEFTGQDVVHSVDRASRKESLLPFASLWREVLDRIEVVDGYQTVFHLKRPHAELLENVLSTWDMMILSKAHWDAEGQKGVLEKPVGTGPFQMKEIKSGSSKLYERVEKHYRVTPDSREIQFFFAPEDATRLATLLAGEAHIAEIPTAIQGQAEAKGMKVVFSTVPAIQLLGVYGGNYQLTPAKLDPKVPFTNKQVRQALNMAINRKEMNDTLFGGRAKIMTNGLFHPSLAGWNPEWENRFNELYGYNPTKAKELLAQAGYPKGFKTTFRLFSRPGVPAMIETGEAIALYWQRIGVEVALETTEFAKVRDDYRDWRGHGMSWLHGFPPQAPWNIVPPFTGNPVARGVVRSYESESITQKMKQVDVAVDSQERDRLQREMGNILFEEFAHIPLFWISAEFVVNPKVVTEYITTGHFGPRHLDYIKLAR